MGVADSVIRSKTEFQSKPNNCQHSTCLKKLKLTPENKKSTKTTLLLVKTAN